LAAGSLPALTASPLYQVNLAGEGGLSRTAQADAARMLLGEVTEVVDGDTLRVRISRPPEGLKALETIRLLGVDTPETVHPSRPVERFGREASAYTKASLTGRQVYLAFDWDLRDRYGRLLAYVYLPATGAGAAGGVPGCFNAHLVREGYAHAYTRYPFQFMEEFRALEQEARREKRGLWGD
jgi:micrococcal nuclease